MLIKPEALKARGILIIRKQADGDYMDLDEVALSNIDDRLIDAIKTKPGFLEVYAYAGPERFWSDDNRTSGATMQMMFSDALKLAAVLYIDPALSGPLISWVKADSPADALHEWTKEMHARGPSPVAAFDPPRTPHKGH
ncbi:hypothetical protein AGRHK599_LOCUS1186 [Rhizobium rhizogenes]|uniref:Uncharacterized protein n=1 Tax=Rhizobium rhizogenes TaxID=359 RepID=A0AAN2DCJ5_RHIRH|nr:MULTISPECIES: hypothetical protein [Rhizobium/Agrobacterium group]AQS61811.1 hypothetical protein B0909_05760 [Rhizobium rhizogenes]MCZ7442960.1 hypothetical protein [Rhizobium rhizogenes]NSZ78949.1 hypothetical protein [Agrobacterium tumefaciens]OAM65743.1 hypothetical protein A8L48_22370 [Rhizobium rhizogenes]CAD0211161.1 hypothetical protein AGRHK599_LOCUS1186 [Rhizobium rhizogenes]